MEVYNLFQEKKKRQHGQVCRVAAAVAPPFQLPSPNSTDKILLAIVDTGLTASLNPRCHGQPLHLRTSPSGLPLPVTKIGEQSLKMSSPPAPGGSTPQRRRTSDPGSRWASLPEDLARMVAFRLLAGDLLDYVRFRAVCTGWRSGTESPRGRGVSDPRFHPLRWMMLPEGHGLYPGRPELDGYVRFLNLDAGTLGPRPDPAAPEGPLHHRLGRRSPAAAAGRRRGRTRSGPCQAGYAEEAIHHCHSKASYTWWILPVPDTCDENIHQVFQIDPPVQDGAGTVRQVQPPKLIATIPADKLVYPDGLVQCGSEILVIGHNEFYGPEFVVCKLSDLVLQRFIPIKNIGGYTLFVYERNISVSSKILPTVKGDNVVFIHSDPPHLAQCNLSTGILSLAIDSCSLYGHVPGPSSLVHHIFSCCIYYQWSRGLIFRRKVDPICLEFEVQILNEM